jgi:hypothetical protein
MCSSAARSATTTTVLEAVLHLQAGGRGSLPSQRPRGQGRRGGLGDGGQPQRCDQRLAGAARRGRHRDRCRERSCCDRETLDAAFAALVRQPALGVELRHRTSRHRRSHQRRLHAAAFCPGFLRGLAFHNGHAVVGLSLSRDGSFSGLALDAFAGSNTVCCALQQK